MRISFFGATHQVSGSTFLLEFEDEYKVLVDCGTDYDRNTNIVHTYGNFPFDASLINLVILTHAHVDHSGQIPNLYLAGFEGQVLCTPPTKDLTEILLHDVASINLKQFKSIDKVHKKSKKRRSLEEKGLYLSKAVNEAIENFICIGFGKRFKFKDRGYLTFFPAGHLLGAAHVLIEYGASEGKYKKIGFSGDIGRNAYPLLVDPVPFPQVDYLVTETTYGDREHQDQGDAGQKLYDIIHTACIERAGRLIVPAFSVGRTQSMLYTLNRLYQTYDLKPIKVFTDSPLAKASSMIYEKYSNYLNLEAREFKEENTLLFDFDNLYYLETSQSSKAISNHQEPSIIISSSGMIRGGRIEYHIEKNIENHYATILLIGYATEDSVAGKLIHGQLKDLRIKNKTVQVNADVMQTDVFSGHGGKKDLLNFVKRQSKNELKKVFLVHGESEPMKAFKSELEAVGYSNILMPHFGESFDLL